MISLKEKLSTYHYHNHLIVSKRKIIIKKNPKCYKHYLSNSSLGSITIWLVEEA